MMNNPVVSASGERGFDRASWLTVAILLGFAAACATVTALVLSQPGDGCLLDAGSEGSTLYACVGDWETPLRPGDRILAVAGVSMGGDDLVLGENQRLTGRVGATLPYTVERGGERLEIEVPIGRLDGWGLLRAFGAGLARHTAGSLPYTSIGMAIIFALAPRSRAAQLLLVACGSGFAVTSLTWTSSSVAGLLFVPEALYVAMIVFSTFWGWLLMPTLVLLVLSFPRRVWPLARWPRATPALLYGLPLAALAATLVTGDDTPYVAGLGLGAVGFLVATIAVTTHTFRSVHDPAVRAQTAWMCLGLMVGIGIWPLLFVAGPLLQPMPPPSWFQMVMDIVTTTGFAVCLGIAITRYRLFDIVVVVNRALVYTLLTGTLVAIYLSSVAVLQGVVRSLAGQESELAVVASTLAVAAGFQPLRGRIQGVIDRLFFRRKYDAAQVLAAYGLALHDDAELETLSAGLARVADETMRPAHVALWLREGEDR